MIKPGDILRNRYEILKTIGRGGMADVYLAFDRRRYTQVAIKVLREDLAEDPDFLRRFAREAQALARLDHPNIVRFYSLERQGPLAYIVMDFVDGHTLRTELTQRQGSLSLYEAASVLHDIGSALYYAHQQGIIHRDLKPGNVLLARDGRALLTDFGIAKALESATVTTMAVGTPAYMSPEQILGEELDARTDIYSLGVMLFQMVTGRRPFTGEEPGLTGTGTLSRLREAHLHLDPPRPSQFNPSLPAGVDDVILKALAKEREARWPDVRQMVIAWDQALAGGMAEGALGWRRVGATSASLPSHPASMPPAPWPSASQGPGGISPVAVQPPQTGARPRKRGWGWLVMIAVLALAFPILWLLLQTLGRTTPSTDVSIAAEHPAAVAATSSSPSQAPSLSATETAVALATQIASDMATQTAIDMATQTAKKVATQVAATKEAMALHVTATVQAQRTATAAARVQATQTAQAQRVRDREAIARVIEGYGDVKIQAMTYLDPSGLSRALIDPVLERKKQTVCWLQKNDAYYTYADRSVDIVDILFQNNNETYVYAWVGEHITFIQRGNVHDWGYDRYKAVYHLRKVGGQWKIDCLTALEDEEDFSPHCEVKFPSQNPCLD